MGVQIYRSEFNLQIHLLLFFNINCKLLRNRVNNIIITPINFLLLNFHLIMKDVIIIGGGLAGLISGIQLARASYSVTLIEKKQYPFHKVCGEYISNEAYPFLELLGVKFRDLDISRINRLMVSSPSGKFLESELQLGGFGISRFALDNYLYKLALDCGVNVISGVAAEKVVFIRDHFMVTLANGKGLEALIVIGSYGKRSRIDKNLDRAFISRKSPYLGVKYHIKTDHPANLIALHNFKDGYGGISKVEGSKYNLCYLSHRDNLKTYKNVKEMEKEVLYKNPFLKEIFTNSEFLTDPLVINEISFETKLPVENHILMVGDAAGMITPLCGNGMAMAIQGAKILSENIKGYFTGDKNRQTLERTYSNQWNREFSKRLWVGRNIQKMFGNETISELMIGFFKTSPALTRFVIRQTHGKPF
jgi:menaquinone-9 beta-reductase